MICPECIGPPRRNVTHRVTLPLVPGATNRRVLDLCFYHASGYEGIDGVVITRIAAGPSGASDATVDQPPV